MNKLSNKFMYYTDNKFIGLIKFAKDITFFVDGYFFRSNFNKKIEIPIFVIIHSTKISYFDENV